MLQLVLGVAGSGKTTKLMQLLKEYTQQDKKCMWLVPEQFSSSAEIMVYHALGDALSSKVDVLSFRTLSERILKTCGGFTLPLITEAGRVVFVRRALDALQEEVKTFARHRRNTAFCSMCADTISELKIAGVTPELLQMLGKTEKDKKIVELAAIFQAYEAAIEGVAADPEDRLTQASKQDSCAYFADKICFIDNFDGFTAPEYALIEQMVKSSEALYVALCADRLDEVDHGMGLFSPVRKAGNRLIELAHRQNVQVKAAIEMGQIFRGEKSGVRTIHTALLYNDEPENDEKVEDVFYTKAIDEWQEIRVIAAEMHRLACLGVPYSNMALICRDVEAYKSVVRREFGLYEIPYFEDASETIEYTAPVAFIRAALEVLRFGISTRPMLNLLKTGLCGYTESEIHALENYLYTWEYANWKEPFDKNPLGLLAILDKEAEKQLLKAETLRESLVPVMQDFLKKSKNKPAAVIAKQLYLLLDHFNGVENAEQAARVLEQAGETVLAENERRAWDLAMDMLDQMVLLVGDEVLSPAEFDDLYLLLVRSTEFGQIPQSLECVVFTGADRMRLASPEYCFVVGVCEGEFPMQVGYSGILTHTDREKLVEKGVEMPGSFQNRVLLEEMFFYRAFTSANKGLYISWPARRGGVVKSMSASLEPVIQLDLPELSLSVEQQGVTPKATFELLCEEYRENSPQVAALHGALEKSQHPWAENALELLNGIDNTGVFRVKDIQTLRQVTGNNIVLSATKAERYYECRFSYFMERILKVKPRRKGELSPLESGTFIHYILEQVLLEVKERFAQCTNEELEQVSHKHADIFIQENFPENSRRNECILEDMKKSVAKLLQFMRDAAAQSDFSIDSLELSLSDKEEGVAPLTIETPEGQTIRVTGQIDRVDVLRKDGKTHLCILDYKTGSKSFSLEDIYYGLNMQMMIYMATLCKNAPEKYPDATPAGVLYLTSDPQPKAGTREDIDQPVYALDGLLIHDTEIVASLDKSRSGVFLPVKYNKDGSLRKGKQLASYEKMGNIMRHIEELLVEMSEGVYKGNFDAVPLVHKGRRPCDYCPYRSACRHEDGKGETNIAAPENLFEPQEKEGEEADG